MIAQSADCEYLVIESSLITARLSDRREVPKSINELLLGAALGFLSNHVPLISVTCFTSFCLVVLVKRSVTESFYLMSVAAWCITLTVGSILLRVPDLYFYLLIEVSD